MTPFAPHTSATARDILYGPPLLIGPVIGPHGPRERSLSDAEVARIWSGASQNDYGDILKLILLTGCRRGEIGDLKWSEIDIRENQTIRLPRERTKNGQEHVVPLSEEARSIIRGAYNPDREYVFGRTRAGGFSGWSKSKAEFDKLVNLKELGRCMIYAAPFAPAWASSAWRLTLPRRHSITCRQS